MRSQVLNEIPLGARLQATVIAIYVAFAGIYWVPGVPHEAIRTMKAGAFLVLGLVGILRFSVRKLSTNQVVIIRGLLLCALGSFIATIVTAGVSSAVFEASNYLEPLIWIIALLAVRQSAVPLLRKYLTIAMTIFCLISIYPVMARAGLLPDFHPPAALLNSSVVETNENWALEASGIANGGFTGSRTGWGVIVALSAIFLAALYNQSRIAKRPKAAVILLIIFGSISSIIATGARGGVIALVTVIGYAFAMKHQFRAVTVAVVVGVFVIIFYNDLGLLLPEGYLRGFDKEGNLLERIDAATTGRFSTYVWALEQFVSSPLWGVGLEPAEMARDGTTASIHNIWLRAMAQSGLVVLFPLLMVTYHLYLLGVGPLRSKRSQNVEGGTQWLGVNLVILCGLLLGLAEPSVIFGAFNANVIFWTAVWMASLEER